MDFIDERLYELICDKALEGRLVIKIGELASSLKDSRGPTYNALKSLEKKKKIITKGRGKKGIEIHLLESTKKSNSLNDSNTTNNITSITTENRERMTKKITLEEISSILTNASDSELEMIKNLAGFIMLNRKQKK